MTPARRWSLPGGEPDYTIYPGSVFYPGDVAAFELSDGEWVRRNPLIRAFGSYYRTVSWRCTLKKGRYTVRVYARDLAGNAECMVGSSKLTVR